MRLNGPGKPPRYALLDEQQRLEAAQLQLVGQLAAYPQYRAVARRYVTLDELRGTLQPGEVYFKLVTLGERSYALLVTPTGGRGWARCASTAPMRAWITRR